MKRITITLLALALCQCVAYAQWPVSDLQVTRLKVQSSATLDDGSGAAPTLVFTDGSDESATFGKVDGSWATVTTEATDGINILTGNLKVGNGTPTVTQDGEDFYAEGTGEFASTLKVVGAVTASNNITCASTVQAEQLTTTDDLTVTDDAGITGALTVGETAAITGAITASNNITCASTVQAEQLTSTDDLTVTDDATISGSLVVSENITCATTFTLGTRSCNVTQYSADPNAAAWLATVTNLDANDYVIATLNTAPGNGAYLLSAVASVGGATITLSADPNESVKITILSFQD